MFRGDTALARRQLEAILRRYPLERIPAADRPYGTLGDITSVLGDVEWTRRLRREFEATTPLAERSAGWAARWDTREAEARRDFPAAIAAIHAARVAMPCAHCGLYQEAQLWDRLGNTDSAQVVLERAVTTLAPNDGPEDAAYYGPGLRRLGQLYEAKGDRDKARDYYQRFVDLWRNADPQFQPQVTDAKQRLAALGGDQPHSR